jgi:hypothetical protein
MPVDYAVMRDRSTARTREQENADLLLTRQADTRMMAASRPAGMVAVLVFLVSQAITGMWMRSYAVPGWEETAAAAGFLLIAGIVFPVAVQAERRSEPDWAKAAAVHEASLAGRVPADTLALLREVMAKMTVATGWRGAYLYVSPCTEQDRQSPHFAPCCAGGTWVKGGRLLVILGEHLVMGNPALALAVLGHERRHLSGWRLHLYSVAQMVGTFGLLVAGWAVPWPLLLMAVAALRAATVLAHWAVEIGCDVGGAREVGIEAMIATVDYKDSCQRGERALWPPAKRAAVAILRWITGPEHPPTPMRRAMIRAAIRQRNNSQ